MKAHSLRRGRIWVLSAAFLGVLLYSGLALNIKPAYASSCTAAQCIEGHDDAAEFCGGAGLISTFQCPTGVGGSVWSATCQDGSATAGLCSQ